jgi:hypothetical protein
LSVDLHIFLQIQEGNGISVASEGVLANVGDVVGAQVEVAQPVQRPQRLGRDLVQAVVAQAEVLQVFW